MARQLLSSGRVRWFLPLLCLPMFACLLPQDDRVLDTHLPPALNQRPRVVTESLSPPLNVDVFVRNGPTCKQDFVFYVEDPDLGDDLQVHVYPDFKPQLVTYDATNNPISDQNRPFVREYDAKNNIPPVRVRRDPVQYTFQPSSDTDGKLGRHEVLAVVGDGVVIGDRVQQARAEDGGFLYLPDGGSADPRYSDSVRWIINVEQGECP